MARLTVEDCLSNVENRFDLVLKASKRAKELSAGATPKIPWQNDKPTVVALREIELGVWPPQKTTTNGVPETILPEKNAADVEIVSKDPLEIGIKEEADTNALSSAENEK